jgi:hypothetical protein
MKYCVLVKISKQQLSFWYQIEGGVFAPLSIGNSGRVPICFYVNGTDFQIGEFAKDRFLVNDKNAYAGYFDLVKDPSNYFILHGDSKPIKQLLYYGIENFLSHFIKTILYKNESIESYRTSFCLRFWFDDDIESQERLLVENLFKEAGYENVAETNADIHLNKELSHETKSARSRICLSAVSNDLFVKLFKAPDFSLLGCIKLAQYGADPRAKILAKLIIEDIKDAHPHIFVDDEKETVHIINHCVQLLSSLSPIIRNKIELSTGVTADYKIRLSDLEERMMYNTGIEDKVIPQLESMISLNEWSSSTTDVILNGDELNTNYFKEKLTKKFSNVFGVGSVIEAKVLKSIFAEVSTRGYLPDSKFIFDSPLLEANAAPAAKSAPKAAPAPLKAARAAEKKATPASSDQTSKITSLEVGIEKASVKLVHEKNISTVINPLDVKPPKPIVCTEKDLPTVSPLRDLRTPAPESKKSVPKITIHPAKKSAVSSPPVQKKGNPVVTLEVKLPRSSSPPLPPPTVQKGKVPPPPPPPPPHKKK